MEKPVKKTTYNKDNFDGLVEETTYNADEMDTYLAQKDEEISELVNALMYIQERDYIEKIGDVETLRKWIHEFRVVAESALNKHKTINE